MSESITWNEALQKYLIIGGTNDPTDPSSWGIFYSTSEDLINWTPRQLLHPFPIPAEGSAGLEPGHFLYGTLVDPSSESPTFDTTDDSFYIYGVIYNEGLDRDLVRYPVEIEQVALEPLAWNFDTDGDAEGWSPLFDLSAFTVGGGELSMVSESDDPYFGSESIRLSALYQTLTITMSVDGDGTDFGQVFFVAEDSNDFFDGDHIVDFEIIADGEPHTYEIDMGQNPNWSGMITQLRIDPSVYGDVEIRIDSITTS